MRLPGQRHGPARFGRPRQATPYIAARAMSCREASQSRLVCSMSPSARPHRVCAIEALVFLFRRTAPVHRIRTLVLPQSSSASPKRPRDGSQALSFYTRPGRALPIRRMSGSKSPAQQIRIPGQTANAKTRNSTAVTCQTLQLPCCISLRLLSRSPAVCLPKQQPSSTVRSMLLFDIAASIAVYQARSADRSRNGRELGIALA